MKERDDPPPLGSRMTLLEKAMSSRSAGAIKKALSSSLRRDTIVATSGEKSSSIFAPMYKAYERNEIRVTCRCQPDQAGRLIKNIDHRKLIGYVVLSPLLPPEEAKAVEYQIKKCDWGRQKPEICTSRILGDRENTHETMVGSLEDLPEVEGSQPDPFPLDAL